MIVEWSPFAARELCDIVDYVAERTPAAADKLDGEYSMQLFRSRSFQGAAG